MKGLIKLRSSCISVLLLLVSMLAVNNSKVNENNINNYLDSDCYSVTNYIEKNFDIFVDKYNESVEENILNASYVENKFAIIIDEAGTKNEGVFLDFDLDNGYAIVGDEYNFYEFNPNGDSPYKGIESESYCYLTVSGYLYLKGDKYVNVDNSKNYSNDFLDDLTFSSTYKDQTEAGCGHITNTATYVEDRYGSGWNLSKSKTVAMATGQYTTQNRLSCYTINKLENDKINSYSEGNCWFVSAYNVLQSLADATGLYKEKVDDYKTDTTKGKMPNINDIVNYDVENSESNVYEKYYDSTGNNISGQLKTSDGTTRNKTVKNSNNSFPKLYTDVRKYVASTYKKVNDGTVYNTANIINEVGKQYGYIFKAKGTIAAGLYGGCGITAIDKELPFALCTASVSNAGYGDHLMAGCGYKTYSKTTGWWIFKTTSYKYFYELRDGHSSGKIYFDLSAWTGFGGIVLLDYSILNY